MIKRTTDLFQFSAIGFAVYVAMCSNVFALEKLEEEELAASTGEGIALIPQEFSMRFNGADDTGIGTLDTGYVRLIPVGPVTAEAKADGFEKADVYLYGFSISQSNADYGENRTADDWGTPFGRAITSWGSANNPWLIKTVTATDVANFAGDTNNTVPYISLEAPLYEANVSQSDAQSAYNLKMNMWMDAYQRDSNVAEVLNTETGLSNRLRLNFAFDGFGINGSNLKIFSTLDGVNAGNVGQGLDPSYNKTLGMAGLIRINSGDTSNLRAKVTQGSVTRSTIVNNATLASNYSGADFKTTYMPLVKNGYGNQLCGSSTNNNGKTSSNNSAHCLTREGVRTITATATATNSWSKPDQLPSVLKIGTQEIGDAGSSPAFGGNAPVFNSSSATGTSDGIYLYGLNANIVLGSLSQPLIFNTDDGSNFSMELTRIPNQENVYKKIYTDYSGQDASYLGSTCNVHQCGTTQSYGGKDYQGSNATHSSITIGSTVYDPTTNTLTAYNGAEAIGISFGEMVNATGLTATNTQNYQQSYQSTRSCNTNWLGNCNGGWGNWGNWQQTANTKYTQNTNGQIYQTISNVPLTNTLNVTPKSIGNNLGSAVIDGVLIQHLKFSTTGLN
ncbi:hypothetical protein SAMN05421749_101678 [Acinetobacter marinus]|uniref:Uncharacterized protein n=1 Tax=Acinetobacter marinus TaxID=281375 RepID=A0A1G6H3A8_9GAMM|nr:hypothetical protein [Acinetobacter marinus]SDB88385.1 hypothetical protein SAMN05421749_101678 [Acinetobacter marinus]